MPKIINQSVTLEQKLNAALSVLPNPSQVLKSKSATMEIFHKVARQADVYPQIASYRSSLYSLKPIVQAENQSVADFFTEYLSKFDLRGLIGNAASARDYGFAVLEVTEYTTLNGRTVPGRVELCPAEFYQFDRERRLRLKTNTSRDGVDVLREWPGKFMLIQNNDTLMNPYGIGLLDIAFWVTVGLNGNFEFLMQFCEEDGRDRWIGYYQPGSTEEQISDLLNMLVRGRNNSVAAVPKGMEVELKEAAGRASSTDLYIGTDEMLRRKIEKLWTGTDLTMQVDGKGGYSSSSNGLTIREEALEEGIKLAASAVGQLCQIVAFLNGMPEVPTITLQMPKTLSKVIAETDHLYYQMGLRPTRELLLKRGYAEDDFILEQAPAGGGLTADFAALPADYDPLLDVFAAYQERIKKK